MTYLTIQVLAMLSLPPASSGSFAVEITNHCPRDLQVVFARLSPNATKAQEERAVAASRPERLAAKSSVVREMRPYERLIIPHKGGRMSGWFDSRATGEGGTIQIAEGCDGVFVTRGSADDQAPASQS